MTEPQSDATNEFAVAMMSIIEMMGPVFEAANGIRADMESQGYLPAEASSVAATFLTGIMQMMLRRAS